MTIVAPPQPPNEPAEWILERAVSPRRRLADRLTRQIHKGLGLEQQHVMPCPACLTRECAEASAVDARAEALGKAVKRKKARVVTRQGIFRAGIAKPHDDMRDGTRGGGLPLFNFLK
jgi:hypothetical protein